MFDAVVIGGGHNGLVAAAYLARAGQSVLVLERRDHVGGAAVSERPWEGVDARLSRYSYLVSLLPRAVRSELGLTIELRRRSVSSYSPRLDGSGLLVRTGRAAERRVRGDDHARRRGRLPDADPAAAVARRSCAARVGDDAAWEALVERPLGEVLARYFEDDFERGIVATDALIGTFAGLDDESLRQNRCFLYHVIGNGTGDWDVPVGGMGALTEGLAGGRVRRRGGAAARVRGDGDRDRRRRRGGPLRGRLGERAARARERRSGRARAAARASPSRDPPPEGAQLKLNLLLKRLPRLRDPSVDPFEAFAGTFHVNESATQLAVAYAQAHRGVVPELAPCEVYCHSLTDPSILGPELREAGAQTLTCFGLHMPARMFAGRNQEAKAEAIALDAAVA